MKLPALLLVGSFAANAALLALFALRPALAPPAFRDFFTSDATRAADLAGENKAAHARSDALVLAAAAKRAGVWATLQTDDLRALIARLRAAGFSPVLVRAIVEARLESTFASRMSELLGAVDTPFWKPDALTLSSSSTSKFFETQSQIFRDRAKALREILGDDYFAGSAGEATAEQRRRYGDLPKSKIDLVQRIADDYAEMISQVKVATNGILLAEDREKLALLEREKRTDLAAVLTPAELEDYEMRTSQITMNLRQAMTLFNATADEFRAIYRAQQPYADLLFPTGNMTMEMSRQRTAAQKQIAEQLQTVLGATRYADYARATDYEYQNLSRLAQRDGLTTDAINRAYDLRTATTRESMRIHEAKLGTEQRAAALQALAASTKAQLAGQLGTTVAESYAKSARWLSSIERGYAIQLGSDGNGTLLMMGPPAPAPKK